MMFYEIPLVAFTVLAQTAVGAHLTVNGAQLLAKPNAQTVARLNWGRFAILVVMGLGFLFSTTHMGSPLRAFNAFNKVGSAALSNEILTGASFLTFAGLYWLLTVLNVAGAGVRKALNVISIMLGVVFMFAMANVYHIDTVPAWHTPLTVWTFWFTVVTLGVMFAAVIVNVAGVESRCVSRTLMALGVSLILCHLAVTAMQVLYFAGLSTAINSGVAHITALSGSLSAQLTLTVIAAMIWLLAELSALPANAKRWVLIIGFVALFAAEIFGRNVFYGMHFTSGLY
nr:DmsC/YnfH family molybdoenzyme membrane anchor subunit [Vibrio furnissii]